MQEVQYPEPKHDSESRDKTGEVQEVQYPEPKHDSGSRDRTGEKQGNSSSNEAMEARDNKLIWSPLEASSMMSQETVTEQGGPGRKWHSTQEEASGQEGPEQWTQHATYAGHGEWIQVSEDINKMTPSGTIRVANTWERLKLETEHKDLMMARLVREKGYPNMYGARIPVKSTWNIDKLEELLEGYEDKEVVEGLRYGWPTGRLSTWSEPAKTLKNDQVATQYPLALREYISKEKSKGAVIRPLKVIPFTSKVGIVDLSFPQGQAVSDGMVKGNYLGKQVELTFPRTDDLAFRIAQLGKGACMFKIDLSHYFRQLPLDPAD